MDRFTKLAAMGAHGAAGGIAALYLLLLWALRPTLTGGAAHATGGMDWIGWQVLAIAMFVPSAILVGAHVALGRQMQQGPRPLPGD